MTASPAPGPARLSPPVSHAILFALTLGALAWGALAFGAVYPWAYWPLAAACLAAGLLGIAVERRAPAGASRALTIALLLLALAGLAQLVPLPRAVLETLSPSTPDVLAQLEPSFATGLTGAHALSIQPSLTWTALALYGSFAFLLLGTSRVASVRGARAVIAAVTALGVLLALAGIIQNATFNGKIYGFWTSQMAGSPFGPFVNKNHFAGWMLLAIPLSLGLLSANIARGMRGVRPVWRDRVLWLASPEANRLILLAGAIAVMCLSLVLTMSRSGISCLALAIASIGLVALSARTSTGRKAATVGYVTLVTVLVLTLVGTEAIGSRFAAADWSDFNARRGAWLDAWRIATIFPFAGTGLNTYGTATLFFQQHDLSHHYAQAHSDYLQLAAEGGALLVVFALLSVVLFARDVRRRFREDGESSSYWIRAGAVCALVAIALQETVEFSLQMPGNAALFAVVCGIALHKSPSRRS
jgi:O-antigen ligase/polysaccharide polymerase Wzy-like membrane protein